MHSRYECQPLAVVTLIVRVSGAEGVEQGVTDCRRRISGPSLHKGHVSADESADLKFIQEASS